MGAGRWVVDLGAGGRAAVTVHATAAETDQTVVVTLTSGRRSDRERMVCTMMIMPGTIVVPLANPVGGRAVLTAA